MNKIASWLSGASLLLMATALLMPLRANAASTISYQYLDGTSVTDSDGNAVTDSNSDTDFTNADAVIGDSLVAYIYEDCREASSPSDITSDTTVTAVTTDMVTDSGTWNDAIWFIYNNKLYITGSGTIAASGGTTGTTSLSASFSGSTYDAEMPSIMYGDIENDGYGIALPSVGDEKNVTDGKYYTYTAPTSEYVGIEVGSDDSSTTTYVEQAPTTTVIPSSVPWSGYAGSITDIYMSDDLVLTGNYAFFFNANSTRAMNGYVNESIYTSLQNVYLYSDITGLTSMAGMFARCPSLVNIYVREGTSTISLTSVTSTAYMFYGDELLVNGDNSLVDLLGLTGSSLIDTDYMFADCQAITQPNVSSYNMANVVETTGMFFGAKNAGLVSDSSSSATYNIYGWSMGNVANSMYMFSGNISTDSDGNINLDDPTSDVDPGLGDIDSSNVITGTVDMSAWGMTNLINAQMMFSQNSGITGVTFASSYPALITTTGMFLRCDNLSTVNMASVSMPVLTKATLMFFGAGRSSTGGTATLTSLSVPALTNAELMFASSGFKTINLDDSSDMSTLVSADAMFADCSYLSTFGQDGLSHFVLSSLESAAYMFNKDVSLITLNTSTWGMGKVTDISFMFADCTYLTNADFSNWSIGTTLTDMECFAYNTSVTSVDISAWDTYNVTNMFMAFAENSDLTSVQMPTSNTSLYNVTVMNGMFYNDTSLESVSAMTSATSLVDARGMFCGCKSLTSVDVSELITTTAKYLAFMFKDCSALVSLDISSWITSAVTYAEGIFDGCSALTTITTGSKLTGANLVSMGMAFKNCYVLTESSLSGILDSLTSTSSLVDVYEMLNNCYAITSLDLSAMDFSAATDYTRMACMDENSSYTTNSLTTIIVPSSFMSADGVTLTDNSDSDGTSINMFWVDGDGTYDGSKEEDTKTDDLLTTFIVTGSTISDNLAAYSFGGTNSDNDNRTFVALKSQTINGEEGTTYTFTDGNSEAVLKGTFTSYFYTGGTSVSTATASDLNYSWTLSDETIDGETTNSYTASNNKGGTYVLSAVPSLLTGNNSPATASFVVSKVVQSITATYNGDTVAVGADYSKDDVTVTAIDEDGNTFTLTSDDWDASSTTVTAEGDNTFTASYTDSEGNTATADFVVPGERMIGSIVATYNGSSIAVGSAYSTDDVTVTAYYLDDTDLSEGFSVSGATFDSTTVTSEGDNTFTATYTDSAQNKSFTDDFTVTGYVDVDATRTIGHIEAEYTGTAILVGEKYDKDDVSVTAYYADDTDETEGFAVTLTKVNSRKVTKAGDNTFTAYYTDSNGNTFTDKFDVNGYKEIDSISASYGGSDVLVGSQYNKDDVTVLLHYNDDSGTASTTNFSLDSQTVTKTGSNSYVATYRDPYGKTYSASFTVTGYEDSSSADDTTDSDTVTASSVYGDDSTGSGVDSAYSTGIVQTGTTTATVVYAVIGVIAMTVAGILIYLRRKEKDY